MARAKKAKAKPKKASPKKSKSKSPKKSKSKADKTVDAVSELLSVLACPKAAINELALSAEHVLDQADVSCGFARFTAAAWADRGAQYGELDAVAREMIDEYVRHATVLATLLDRLAPMAEEDDHADHEDLDPMDVLARIQPMLTDEATA